MLLNGIRGYPLRRNFWKFLFFYVKTLGSKKLSASIHAKKLMLLEKRRTFLTEIRKENGASSPVWRQRFPRLIFYEGRKKIGMGPLNSFCFVLDFLSPCPKWHGLVYRRRLWRWNRLPLEAMRPVRRRLRVSSYKANKQGTDDNLVIRAFALSVYWWFEFQLTQMSSIE